MSIFNQTYLLYGMKDQVFWPVMPYKPVET